MSVFIYPSSLARKPGPNRHLSDEGAATLKHYFSETGSGPADAARQFGIHYVAARRRYRGWRFHEA